MEHWPRVVDGFWKGKVYGLQERTPLTALLFVGRSFNRGSGMPFLVDCSMGFSEVRKELLFGETPHPYFQYNLDRFLALCEGFDVETLPESFRVFDEPVPVEAVFLHGDFDTKTPLRNALETKEQFPNGHVILVKGGTHNVLAEAFDAVDDMEDVILDWLRDGKVPSSPITLPATPFSDVYF